MADEKVHRVGVDLDEKIYKKLIKEASNRKINREDGPSISGVIRDALNDFFAKKRAA